MPASLVLGALLLWVLLSLAVQFPPLGGGPFVLRYLAPRWALFTVSPALMSVTAWFRVEDPQAGPGEWLPLPPERRRPWYVAVWGPDRRLGKIHADLAMALAQHRLAGPRALAPAWPAYRVLLDRALASVPPGSRGRVRFCLRTEAPDWPEPRTRILFLSEPHPVP